MKSVTIVFTGSVYENPYIEKIFAGPSDAHRWLISNGWVSRKKATMPDGIPRDKHVYRPKKRKVGGPDCAFFESIDVESVP